MPHGDLPCFLPFPSSSNTVSRGVGMSSSSHFPSFSGSTSHGQSWSPGCRFLRESCPKSKQLFLNVCLYACELCASTHQWKKTRHTERVCLSSFALLCIVCILRAQACTCIHTKTLPTCIQTQYLSIFLWYAKTYTRAHTCSLSITFWYTDTDTYVLTYTCTHTLPVPVDLLVIHALTYIHTHIYTHSTCLSPYDDLSLFGRSASACYVSSCSIRHMSVTCQFMFHLSHVCHMSVHVPFVTCQSHVSSCSIRHDLFHTRTTPILRNVCQRQRFGCCYERLPPVYIHRRHTPVYIHRRHTHTHTHEDNRMGLLSHSSFHKIAF